MFNAHLGNVTQVGVLGCSVPNNNAYFEMS